MGVNVKVFVALGAIVLSSAVTSSVSTSAMRISVDVVKSLLLPSVSVQ